MDTPRSDLSDFSSVFEADELREAHEEKVRQAQLQMDEDIRHVMSMPAGRRLLWAHLDRSGMWRSSFTGDRQGTDFREGMRNTALMLWGDLQRVCPKLLLRMQEENQ